MTDKTKYINLCNSENSIPLFCQYWWLDAVCGEDNWNVVIYEKDGVILGAHPFYKKKIFNVFRLSVLPKQTQILGPWIRPKENITYSGNINYENEVLEGLINLLPKVDFFQQQFHHSFKNWLSYHWAGYSCSVNYTYIIKDISNIDIVLNSFGATKRNRIKKASKSFIVHIDNDYEAFYQFHQQVLANSGKNISYSKELFQKMYSASTSRLQGAIFSVKNDDGVKAASLFVVWDKNAAYHLITASNINFSSSGAIEFLTFEVIKYLSSKTKSYDFEGSMLKGVEFVYRNYGTEQVPYYRISKVNSLLLQLLFCLKKQI